MTAFNAVRFRVKPGRDQDFLEAHRAADRSWPGLRHANLIQTVRSVGYSFGQSRWSI